MNILCLSGTVKNMDLFFFRSSSSNTCDACVNAGGSLAGFSKLGSYNGEFPSNVKKKLA